MGFFQVVGHGISADLYAALFRETRRFFALPLDAKMQYYIGKSRHHRGYVPPGEEVFEGAADAPDSKEAFDTALELSADDPAVRAGTPLLGPNVWPDEVPGLASAANDYYAAVFALGRQLLRTFALALDLADDHFDRFVSKPTAQLRLLHYPAAEPSPSGLGIGPHTDYECFTLLRCTGPGLEVQNQDDEWIGVPLEPEAYVVNIGDLLEIWTGGAFVATRHRVRSSGRERYSFPFFFAVDYETRIEPLQAASSWTDESPSLIAGEHLMAQTRSTFRYLGAGNRR